MDLTKEHLVLCVDDEAPILGALRRCLRGEPYELITLERPGEALDLVRRRPVSLVISDQRMPELSGLELVKAVNRLSPATSSVILTGYPDTTTISERMAKGIQRLIAKPWNDDRLRSTIRQLLREKEIKEGLPLPEMFDGLGRDLMEIVVRAPCRGRTAADVLDRLQFAMAQPEAFLSGLVVLFDQFGALEDSLGTVLKEVVRGAWATGVPTMLLDDSGFSDAFLEVHGWPPFVSAYPIKAGVRRKRVLVVGQSDPYNLEVLVTAVGHRCGIARTPDDADRRLAEEHYDVVLLDLDTTEAGALCPLLETLKGRRHTSLVLLAHQTDPWNRMKFPSLGIPRCLSKPLRAKEVLDTIRDID